MDLQACSRAAWHTTFRPRSPQTRFPCILRFDSLTSNTLSVTEPACKRKTKDLQSARLRSSDATIRSVLRLRCLWQRRKEKTNGSPRPNLEPFLEPFIAESTPKTPECSA